MSWFSDLFKSVRRFFSMTNSSEKVIAELEEYSKDLVYISEMDGYFSTFEWKVDTDTLSNKHLRSHLNKPSDTPIQEISVNQFFRNKVKLREHYSEAKRRTVTRFQELVECIESNLTDPKVFKIGQVKKEVYIIGKVNERYIGLKTNVVET